MILEEGKISEEKLKEYCKELKEKIPPNKKILFIRGPEINLNSFEKEVALNKGYYVLPPTGLQYLAAAIENRGFDVKIINLGFEVLKKVKEDDSFNPNDWISILKKTLEEYNPSIVGVTNLFEIYKKDFEDILRFLKEDGKRIIIAGGQTPTYNGGELLGKGLCHFVCKREGENKLNFLLDNLFEENTIKAIPGILFKHKEKLETTGEDLDIVELKGNLIKTYELVPIEEYSKLGCLSAYSRMAGKNLPFATLLFTRGCMGNCRFCGVKDFMGAGVRTREINDVLDEIEYLYKEKGTRFFDWLDDDFTRYRDKTIALLQGIIDRGLNIKWASTNGFRAPTLDEELMKKMSESGCIGFHIGIESGNPEKLKEIRKIGNLETFKEFSKLAAKFPELFISDNYILGLPKDNFGSMLDSLYFSLEMNLDWSSFITYQPFLDYFEDGKKGEGGFGSYVPAKNNLQGDFSENSFTGINIFKIPKTTIPSKEQIKQIWFAFNLIRNFIYNKNLMSDRNPQKFIDWTEPVQERYPTHPYLTLFLALAYLLNENQEKAEEYYKKTLKNIEDDFWKQKMKEFKLIEIIDNFPRDRKETEKALKILRKDYDLNLINQR